MTNKFLPVEQCYYSVAEQMRRSIKSLVVVASLTVLSQSICFAVQGTHPEDRISLDRQYPIRIAQAKTETAVTERLNQNSAIQDLVFEEEDGMVAVEAEHFFTQTLNSKRSFCLTSKDTTLHHDRKEDPNHSSGASGGAYLEILPDTRRTHADKLIEGENFSNVPGKLAVLKYKVYFNNPGRYYVWARAFSTGSEDNGLHVGVNGEWPQSGQRMQWCEGKHQWWWESKQRTEEEHCGVPHRIFLDIEKPGLHTIEFSMREDGFEFDRWLMTMDREFNRPIGGGPATKVRSGKLPKAYPVAPLASVLEPSRNEFQQSAKLWHKMTFRCLGPHTSETANPNPFRDFRLNVTFEHKATGKKLIVPGYYAADGNAADTSATAGNIWHVHFTPDKLGRWEYEISFRAGRFLATIGNPRMGKSAGFCDGRRGSFIVEPSDKQGVDFRAKGRLQYVGEHYLMFAGCDEYFLKCGVDAPENLLAYNDFDGEFKNDGHGDKLIKTWQPHVRDWQQGDPTWGGGRGKGLIGAVNYLASKGLNAMSFLTMNIDGDDKNVYPYIDYNERERFDVSKLAQWERVFEHAQSKGIFLHFKTQEHENQGLLDGGGVGLHRKMYYRELIARFGHHLALNWNLGEENGEWGKEQKSPFQSSPNRIAMAKYFHDNDPYRHLVVIHNGNLFHDLLGNRSHLSGASVQTNKADFSNVHGMILKWRKLSSQAGKRWVVSCDEPGDAQHALITDGEDPEHKDARINGLWGTIMAGGAGIEWYFGYAHPESDLTCQDWRSRDLMWEQCRHALDFFAGRTQGATGRIALERMEPNDELVTNSNFCLYDPGKQWLVYMKSGRDTQLRVGFGKANYDITWFNPREGSLSNTIPSKPINGKLSLRAPDEKDWLVVVSASE